MAADYDAGVIITTLLCLVEIYIDDFLFRNAVLLQYHKLNVERILYRVHRMHQKPNVSKLMRVPGFFVIPPLYLGRRSFLALEVVV